MSGSLEKVQFLLVDDCAHMLCIVKSILHGYGARSVVEANSSAEAHAYLRDRCFDIAIVDHEMLGEDGVSLSRWIRTAPNSPAPFIPIIMLTAHGQRSAVVAARDAGVTEFCIKPVTPVDLWNKIAAVIDRPRAHVRTDTYAGPDRRRRPDAPYAGPDRRGNRPRTEV